MVCEKKKEESEAKSRKNVTMAGPPQGGGAGGAPPPPPDQPVGSRVLPADAVRNPFVGFVELPVPTVTVLFAV